MLDKQAALFNRALQAALRESIEDEVEAVMPGALSVLRPAAGSDNSSGPSSMALLDVDEIERHLLVDRVAQKFNSRYEAQLKPLTISVGALLRQEDFALVDNPFLTRQSVAGISDGLAFECLRSAAAEDFVSGHRARLLDRLGPLVFRPGGDAGARRLLCQAGAPHQAHFRW